MSVHKDSFRALYISFGVCAQAKKQGHSATVAIGQLAGIIADLTGDSPGHRKETLRYLAILESQGQEALANYCHDADLTGDLKK